MANGGADCGVVPWPGWRTTAYHAMVTPPDTENWRGSLVDGMRDATGQMYRRNRYYDPQTGQFTQPDPIGLAGGLNAYGFAAGDPVSYDDPYGLNPCTSLGRAAAFAGAAAGGDLVLPIGDAIGALCLANALVSTGLRWYRAGRAAEAFLSTASGNDEVPAAGRLPDLTGKTQEEAEATLEEAGFERGRNTGSYRRYSHEDGSQVSVGPDGRVVRQGPQVQNGPNARAYRRRYGPDGKQINHDPSGGNTHSTGEVINVQKP